MFCLFVLFSIVVGISSSDTPCHRIAKEECNNMCSCDNNDDSDQCKIECLQCIHSEPHR